MITKAVMADTDMRDLGTTIRLGNRALIQTAKSQSGKDGALKRTVEALLPVLRVAVDDRSGAAGARHMVIKMNSSPVFQPKATQMTTAALTKVRTWP